MDVRLLDTFRIVMEGQSMTRAAQLLGVTQPAVSAQIARLEAQVGFALFDRVGGRLKASPGGRRFYAEVCNALDMLERLADTAKNIRTGSTETVSVVSHPAASTALLPRLVARLLAERPEARVRMINRTSEDVRAIFETGAADIAIAEWPINLPGVELRRYRVPTVAVMSANHALAAERRVTAKTLCGVPFIAMPEARLIGHAIRTAFIEAGASYVPVAESEYFSTICGLVAAGAGVSIVDLWSAQHFRALGLAARPFEPRIPYEVAVVRREGAVPSSLADALMDLIDADLRAFEAYDEHTLEEA